ncbi:MAG: DNA-directed RNA polymerase subunit A' [archaeon]|nr:DNA-directed RNA polymerase subunit A' [archaeon]MCR4323768.1 DNA-directed RNA polymerase subunit A' [Nanoarchaeota archaeon]
MIPIKKQISGLNFSLLSPEQIKKLSVAKIVTPELYDVDGYPVDGGLMDLRLGAVDPGVRCRTCGGRLKECLGHTGMIELARPLIHVKYLPIIDLVLRSTCEACGKVLIKEEKDLKKPLLERIKKARDGKKCPHCSIIQERVRLEKPTTFRSGRRRLFPSEIRERLVKVSDADLKILGINGPTLRPEWAILTLLMVPAVTVRPSITLESGERSEDDLTHKLSDIIRSNQRLWENLNAGAPEVIIEDLWDLLQYHVTTFFDNSIAKIPPARHRSGQPLKTITERIKGKEGRIRKNLAGKRVNFSARTVISPDPSLRLNEVGIPFEVAKILTVAEKVTSVNINRLKDLIKKKSYPAANYIVRHDGKKKRITDELIDELVEEIEPGYVVQRHLVDGDIVLFNRHPSLHRASLMAHFVKVLPGKTFRLHPATCKPYNADFDGDEMNIHAPQTEEGRSEAKILLNVDENLFSPKNNMNLMGCVKDAVSGNYMFGESELSKEDSIQLLYEAGAPIPTLNKMNQGSDIFSKIMPNEISKKTTFMDFKSEKGNALRQIDKELGRKEAMELLRAVFSIGTIFLSRTGFTLAVSDLDVPVEVKKKTEKVIEDAEIKTQKIIESYYNQSLESLPGKTLEETREIQILTTLNETRTEIGDIVKAGFPKDNLANKMISSGAGGSMLHITQIACSVGQQVLNGRRIDFGYTGRTLPFFKKGDLSPGAGGFIYNSFVNGLKPQEFFFGAMTGRDGLMDTALRTPKSGYLYRRLANALQDLVMAYDGTVRDASNNVIQFVYGIDGVDVSAKHLNKKVSPGESIGIVTAQSFGEASTQMVLNVFHAAGVAEVQVTQGLPRIIEIFDARKLPKTPAMEIYLEKEFNDEKNARLIAEKIREAKLKEVISEISIDFGSKKIKIDIDSKALKAAHISLDKAVEVLNEKGFKTKKSSDGIVLDMATSDFKEIYKTKEKIKEVILTGIKNISQVLVVKRDRNFVILTAGSNLKEILEFKGVDSTKTISNDIHEISEILGIEAARQAIIHEIQKVIVSQGLDIDSKHSMLVADTMTSYGAVKGITRMGIISDKSSILARASFETPVPQFVQATKTGKKDKLASVIENIIINQPIPVGTGLPGLLVKVTGSLAEPKSKKVTVK